MRKNQRALTPVGIIIGIVLIAVGLWVIATNPIPLAFAAGLLSAPTVQEGIGIILIVVGAFVAWKW